MLIAGIEGKRAARTLFIVPFVALALSTRTHAGDRLFGSTGRGGFSYYESSVSKFTRNGELFFGVTGYAIQSGHNDKIEFKALFNCGNRSRIARKQFYDRNYWEISDRVKYVHRPEGIWYSLQSHHCPNNHFMLDATELWK